MAGHGFTIGIGSVVNNMFGVNVGSVWICLMNEDPPVTAQNPIIVTQLDNGFPMQGQDPELNQVTWSGPSSPTPDGRVGCREVVQFKTGEPNFREAQHVRLHRANGTMEIDQISFVPESMSPQWYWLFR
jgi:hypothetical protein